MRKKGAKLLLLFVFLFYFLACVDIVLDFSKDESATPQEKALTSLKKRKGILRTEIGTLDKAIRSKIYLDIAPTKHQRLINLKKRKKEEVKQLEAQQKIIEKEILKKRTEKYFLDKQTSTLKAK